MFEILNHERLRIGADRGFISVMAGMPPTVEIDQKYPSRQLQQYFDILVRAKTVTIRDSLDGFRVEYPNGVVVSMFFGAGSQSDNWEDPIDCSKETDSCRNTELMILSERPEINKTLTLTGNFKEEGEWGTLDYQTPEDVLRALQWADRFSKDNLDEMFQKAPTNKEHMEQLCRNLEACLARMEAEEREKAAREKAEKEPKRLEAGNVC